MQTLGYVMITLGFLVGTLFAVQTGENVVTWTYFVPAFVLAAVGVALAQIAARRATQSAETVARKIQDVVSSLDQVVKKIEALDGEKGTLDVYDLPQRIDDTFPHDLNVFVEARKSIGTVHGLQAYAEVMNEFAAGERYLNRVWSAAVDGYIDEAHEYLGRSREQFRAAQTVLRNLIAKPGNA